MSSPRQNRLGFRFLFLFALAIASIFPLIWVICASLKSGEDLFSNSLLPWRHLNHITLSNYEKLFSEKPFGRWMINSIFLASAQTVAAVILASLGGFAVAKYRFAGRRIILAILLSVMLLPYQVLLPAATN